MIELTQIVLIAMVCLGHIKLACDDALAPVERQQGFAELYIDGRFVKFIDLR